jgi:VanZ family protein
VLWGSLKPDLGPPSTSMFDKVEHAGAYCLLALLGAWSFRPLLPLAAGLILFGAGVEVLQAVMDLGREGDVLDALANTVGVAVGLGLTLALRRR